MTLVICHTATAPIAPLHVGDGGSARTQATVQAVRTAAVALLRQQDHTLAVHEQEISVSHHTNGAPYIVEYPHIMVSVTHTSDHAYAMVCSGGHADV